MNMTTHLPTHHPTLSSHMAFIDIVVVVFPFLAFSGLCVATVSAMAWWEKHRRQRLHLVSVYLARSESSTTLAETHLPSEYATTPRPDEWVTPTETT